MDYYTVSYTVYADMSVDSEGDFVFENFNSRWHAPSSAKVEEIIKVKEGVIYRDNEDESNLFHLSKKIDGVWHVLEGSEWLLDSYGQCDDTKVLNGKFVELI